MSRAAEAFLAHRKAWNERERDAWLAVFSPDVTMEDPVGGVPKHGLGALRTTWEKSQAADRRWVLEPRRIVPGGDEAAIDLVNRGTIEGRDVTIESIEIWKVDSDGLVVSVRTFFAGDPTVHDPYYLPAD